MNTEGLSNNAALDAQPSNESVVEPAVVEVVEAVVVPPALRPWMGGVERIGA